MDSSVVKMRKASTVLGLLLLTAVGLATPAVAGSHTSMAEFNHNIVTPTIWAEKGGTHTVESPRDSNVICDEGALPGLELFTSPLVGFDIGHGWRRIQCDDTFHVQWHSNDRRHYVRFGSNHKTVTLRFIWTYP